MRDFVSRAFGVAFCTAVVSFLLSLACSAVFPIGTKFFVYLDLAAIAVVAVAGTLEVILGSDR